MPCTNGEEHLWSGGYLDVGHPIAQLIKSDGDLAASQVSAQTEARPARPSRSADRGPSCRRSMRRANLSSSRFAEQYDMVTLSPAAIFAPLTSASSVRVRAYRDRRRPLHNPPLRSGDPVEVGPPSLPLFGERSAPACRGDRVARRRCPPPSRMKKEAIFVRRQPLAVDLGPPGWWSDHRVGGRGGPRPARHRSR